MISEEEKVQNEFKKILEEKNNEYNELKKVLDNSTTNTDLKLVENLIYLCDGDIDNLIQKILEDPNLHYEDVTKLLQMIKKKSSEKKKLSKILDMTFNMNTKLDNVTKTLLNKSGKCKTLLQDDIRLKTDISTNKKFNDVIQIIFEALKDFCNSKTDLVVEPKRDFSIFSSNQTESKYSAKISETYKQRWKSEHEEIIKQIYLSMGRYFEYVSDKRFPIGNVENYVADMLKFIACEME